MPGRSTRSLGIIVIWLWFIIILAIATAAIPLAAVKHISSRVVIVVALAIVILECALLGRASQSWETRHVLASWLFTIVVPWLAAVSYVCALPYSKRPLIATVGMPLIYGLFFVIGAAIGDTSGLVPQ